MRPSPLFRQVFFKQLHDFVLAEVCFRVFFNMSINFSIPVWHAGVTELQSGFIKDFAKFVPLKKMFDKKSKKVFNAAHLQRFA